MIDEGDILNYLGANIKKHLDGTFKLSQLHLAEKIINYVRLEVYAGLKARETPAENPLSRQDEYSLGRKLVWNYREEVGMLSYLQG